MHAVAPPTATLAHSLEAILHDLSVGSPTRSLAARAILYEPDTPAASLYFIIEGQLRSHQVAPGGDKRLVEILGPGDWCGAAALAGLPGYGVRVEAAAATVVSTIPAGQLFDRLKEIPEAGADMIRQLAGKLAAYREEAAELVFDDCAKRLVRTLWRLSESPAATPTPEGVILRITHQQLAQAVGVARETISLALSQLRRRGLLRTGRNKLIFDPQKLSVELGE